LSCGGGAGERPTTSDRPVVVGIDGSETSTNALQWSARVAAVRDAPLHVVHAWHIPVTAAPIEQVVNSVESAARGVLDAALADPALAGLKVEGHMPCLGAVQALLECAGAASLIVVGSRGLGRFGRALLGSTSRQLAHHAPCPIVVVPPTDH
jgi:nucleotide-binding universal stress UspA family protein